MKTSNKLLLALFAVMFISMSAVIVKVRQETGTSTNFVGKSVQVIKQSSFDRISIRGNVAVKFSQGKVQDVSVDSSSANLVMMDVTDGQLKVYAKKKLKRPVEVRITAENLKEIDMNAGASFSSTNQLNLSNLTVKANAGSILKLDGSITNSSLELNAGCVATLTGEGANLTLESNAGSILNADNFKAQDVKISANAGSIAKIDAGKTLSVHINSGSQVAYKGNPQMGNIEITGGANLKKIE